MTATDADQIAELEREVRERHRANAILRTSGLGVDLVAPGAPSTRLICWFAHVTFGRIGRVNHAAEQFI